MSEKSESVQSESASAHVMSAGEMAHECGTDPKTFRRFLRASMRAQGRGDALSSADVETYRRLFASWERRSGGATFIDASSLDVSGDDS
jgi:hypothetical protein